LGQLKTYLKKREQENIIEHHRDHPAAWNVYLN
jgi:hypothetical protein